MNRTVYNNLNNRSFIYRLEKARVEEEDKKRRVVPDLSRQLKDKWAKGQMNRSSSMGERETTIYKQTLRDDLHALTH